METMVKKIENIKDIVKHFLEKNAKTRDDDGLLYWLVYTYKNCTPGELARLSIDNNIYRIKLVDFALAIRNNTFIPETIRRARQLIQQKHPELRGTRYEEKQGHGIITTQQIHTIKDE